MVWNGTNSTYVTPFDFCHTLHLGSSRLTLQLRRWIIGTPRLVRHIALIFLDKRHDKDKRSSVPSGRYVFQGTHPMSPEFSSYTIESIGEERTDRPNSGRTLSTVERLRMEPKNSFRTTTKGSSSVRDWIISTSLIPLKEFRSLPWQEWIYNTVSSYVYIVKRLDTKHRVKKENNTNVPLLPPITTFGPPNLSRKERTSEIPKTKVSVKDWGDDNTISRRQIDGKERGVMDSSVRLNHFTSLTSPYLV